MARNLSAITGGIPRTQRVVAGLDRVEVPEKFARAPTTTGFRAPLAVLRTAS